MLRQLFVVSRLNEIFQFGIHRRRNTGQKLPEFQGAFRGIHAQVHLMMDHPDEPESRFAWPVPDFAKAPKDASVGVCLEVFPDDIQGTLGHLVSGQWSVVSCHRQLTTDH